MNTPGGNCRQNQILGLEMALLCSSCNFPISSLESHKKISNSRPFTAKRLFCISATPAISRFSIFFTFNPSLRLPHCCTSSSSSSSSSLSTEPSWDITPTTIVFVKGLAKSTSQESLKTAFSQFGDVSRVKIITDKKTGQSLGFAYIWFSNEEFSQRAIEELNGKFFEGRFIHVTTARPGSCKTHVKATPYKF